MGVSKCLEVIGDPGAPPYVDVVRTFQGETSGQWTVTAMTYIPVTQTGEFYFIVLNTYTHGGPKDWSVQLNMTTLGPTITDEGGSAGGNPGGGFTLVLFFARSGAGARITSSASDASNSSWYMNSIGCSIKFLARVSEKIR